jgi:hypothetical protein
MNQYVKLCHTLAVILLFMLHRTSAQGLLLDHDAYNLLPRQPSYSDGSKSENNFLRGKYRVDLRPYCPKPQSQGAIGSCTGWAVGYGAMTILESVNKQWSEKSDTITESAFSALFVYNQVKSSGSCDAGAHISSAAAFLCKKGNLRSREFDRIKNNCDKQPSSAELNKASANCIKDFVALFSTDDASLIKIEKTKLSLSQNKPVVIGMYLRNNFRQLRTGAQYWRPDAGDTTFLGAHAMVVVGYDDGREAFEIMNSWGPSWGNGGFIWIKYSDYANFCCYGLQLIPYTSPDLEKPHSARLKLQRPFYDDQDNLSFKEEDVKYTGKYYELSRGYVSAGYQTQLFFSNITADAYLYVFSFNNNHSVNLHWPRDGKLDAQFQGKNESAIIAFSQINLAVPDEFGALSFTTKGTEYICVLVAHSPLEQLNSQLLKLQKMTSGDFMENLYHVFGSDLVPQTEVEYMASEANVSVYIRNRKIIPLVFRIKVN